MPWQNQPQPRLVRRQLHLQVPVLVIRCLDKIRQNENATEHTDCIEAMHSYHVGCSLWCQYCHHVQPDVINVDAVCMVVNRNGNLRYRRGNREQRGMIKKAWHHCGSRECGLISTYGITERGQDNGHFIYRLPFLAKSVSSVSPKLKLQWPGWITL